MEEANIIIREAGLSPLHNILILRKSGQTLVLGTGKMDYKSLKKMLADK
jgi:hypothetical protein